MRMRKAYRFLFNDIQKLSYTYTTLSDADNNNHISAINLPQQTNG